MTSSHLNRACAVAAAFVSLACLPAAARAVEIPVEIPECASPTLREPGPDSRCVFDFEGTVTDIGVQRGVDQVGGIEYRINGTFKYAGALNLSQSKITFHNLFDEINWGPCPVAEPRCETDENGNRKGNGEMVLTTNNVDLVCPDDPLRPGGCVPALATLLSAKSSKKDGTEAKYETDSRFRPPMRVVIENNAGEWEFDVRLDRGTSPQVTPPKLLAKLPPGKGQFPKLCTLEDPKSRPITKIRIRFTIEQQDGNAVPLTLDFVSDWECDPPGRYHLRSR
jgi:hypothetical protein